MKPRLNFKRGFLFLKATLVVFMVSKFNSSILIV